MTLACERAGLIMRGKYTKIIHQHQLWDVVFILKTRYDTSMLIWTYHAKKQLLDRKFPQSFVERTMAHPDTKVSGREKGTIEYQKRFDSSVVTVIGTRNDQHELVIVSCWIDPPRLGTKDAKKKASYHAYQRAGFWGKVWIILKRQLGLSL